MAAFLAKRIGNGSIISVDIDPRCLETARKNLSRQGLLDKVSLREGDLRELDFVEDNTVDLVIAYGTLHTIEDYTPGGTIPVLREFFRVLRPRGTLCATGGLASRAGRDEAKTVLMRLNSLERAVAELIGESHEVDHSPQWLKERLEQIGFIDTRWTRIDNGIMLGLRYLERWIDVLRPLIQEIASETLRTAFFRELEDIERSGKQSGLKDSPCYAIYARKP